MKKPQSQITRKEALTKMGKYAALTAAGTFLLLNPKTAQACSTCSKGAANGNVPIDPGNGNGNGKKK